MLVDAKKTDMAGGGIPALDVWLRENPQNVHANLRDNFEMLTEQRKRLRFFLPKCGKSADLIFLYQRGHVVIGNDEDPEVCSQFFKDNKLQHEFIEDHQEQVKRYRTPDKRLIIYCCNFFHLGPTVIGGKVDCIFDRGSLVYREKRERKRYVNTILNLCRLDRFNYLLCTVEYDQAEREAAPYSVDKEEVYALFSMYTAILEIPTSGQAQAQHGFNEKLYLLTKPPEDTEGMEYLQKYYETLTRGRKKMVVFLPKCGRAPHIFYLYQKGHTVFGQAIDDKTAEDIFKTHKLSYELEPVPEIDGWCYRTIDRRLQVWACPFEKFDPRLIRPVNTIFDRAAFETTPMQDKPAFVAKIFDILPRDWPYIILMTVCITEGGDNIQSQTNEDSVAQCYGIGHQAEVKILECAHRPDLAAELKVKMMFTCLFS